MHLFSNSTLSLLTSQSLHLKLPLFLGGAFHSLSPISQQTCCIAAHRRCIPICGKRLSWRASKISSLTIHSSSSARPMSSVKLELRKRTVGRLATSSREFLPASLSLSWQKFRPRSSRVSHSLGGKVEESLSPEEDRHQQVEVDNPRGVSLEDPHTLALGGVCAKEVEPMA